MGNFLGDGSLIRSQTRGETSNSSHDSVVSNVDDNTDGSSFHRIGGEESKILGLQWILVGEFWSSGLGLGFSSEGRIVNLELSGFNNSEICRNSVSKLHLDNVSESEFSGGDSDFLTVTSGKSILGNKILERLHDLGRLGLLIVGEDTSDSDDSSQDNTQVQVVIWRLLVGGGLDTVGDEAENGSEPEQTGESRKEILTEFDPFWSCGGRGQLVQTMFGNTSLGLGSGQTIGNVGSKPLAQLVKLDLVYIKL